MSSTAAQYRNEKKRVEEAVARVREVVHSASKNDIILALHNFDLDVNRTIQAFCDDGAQSALDSWERTGSTANKKRTQKKKKASATPANSTQVAQAAPSKQQPMPTTASNGHINFGDRSSLIANGDVKSAPTMAPPSASMVVENMGSSAIKEKEPLAPSHSSNSSTVTNFRILNDDQKSNVLSTEISSLKSHDAEIEKIEMALEHELTVAEENVRSVFKSVRQLLADRESHLLAELRRAHDDGARMLNERRVQACELYERGLRIAAMSEREQAELRDEMATFAAQTAAEREIGHASRFLYDNTQLIKLVKNFGQVVGVKGMLSGGPSTGIAATAQQQAVGAIKHSTSHSSIVSSLGEDSGLGHISPVANEKQVVEVSNGGICMKSDALSVDELADLNKKLQETLKAQGIDASVLSGIGSGTMPVRRRPTGPRVGSGRGGGQARRGQMARMPQLSILQS